MQELLGELTTEVFYRLAGELRFVLNPIPEDKLLLFTDRRIDPHSLRSLRNLQPAADLTLRDLLELRSARSAAAKLSHITTKLTLFDQHYQEVLDTNNHIPRNKYKQQWQKFSRQLQILQQQVTNLATFLGKSEQATKLEQQVDEIAYEQRRITDSEEILLQDTLKRLAKNRQELQDKLTEVFNRAIEQAKIDKVMRDLKLGEH